MNHPQSPIPNSMKTVALPPCESSAIMIAVEAEGVSVQEKTPQFDRARLILEGIKTAWRMNLAGQVMLGGELSAIKAELGFTGRGGDRRSKPHSAVLKRTWDEWCRIELRISSDTGDRCIGCFEIVRKRAERLGEDSGAFRLMEAPPASLSEEDRKILQSVITALLKEDSQKSLLQELQLIKGPNILPGGAPATKKPQVKTMLDEIEKVASGIFLKLCFELTKTAGEVERFHHGGAFEAHLYALPLATDEPEILGLLDFQKRLEEVKSDVNDSLAGLLKKVGKAIETKTHCAAAPPLRKRKPTNGKLK